MQGQKGEHARQHAPTADAQKGQDGAQSRARPAAARPAVKGGGLADGEEDHGRAVVEERLAVDDGRQLGRGVKLVQGRDDGDRIRGREDGPQRERLEEGCGNESRGEGGQYGNR